MHQGLSEVRLAARALVRDRGVSLTALATFALCVGANVAIFAVVKAVLLEPLPFREPERLVVVFNAYPKAGVARAANSVPHFLERRENLKLASNMAAHRGRDAIVGDAGLTQRVAGLRVSPEFFDVLGVAPAVGRSFQPREAEEGNEAVVILSHGFWQQHFGGDPAVLGRPLRIDGAPHTVVGVMPKDFRYGSTREVRLWTPLVMRAADRAPDQRHSNSLGVIARLAPGASVDRLQQEVDALNAKVLETDPYRQLVQDAGFRTEVHGMHADITRNARQPLWLLQGGAAFVLLIGAVNLTNLMLVRASARAKEMAVRRVLGAGLSRIARQALIENALLAGVGGLLGVGLGTALLPALQPLGLDQLPRGAEVRVDAVVTLVALAVALLTGALLALPVVLQHLGANPGAALSVESRGGTTHRRQNRLREGLIVTQIALAFALLTGATLLSVSFGRVLRVNPGFEPDNLLTAQLNLPRPRFTKPEARRDYVQRLLAELGRLPSVQAVAVSSGAPFTNGTDANVMRPEGYQAAPGESLQAPFTTSVAGDFFATLGIRLREGRLFTADDADAEPMLAVIDERFARRYWPHESPVGRRIFNGTGSEPDAQTFTVVGVVAPVKQTDLAEPVNVGAVYLQYRHQPSTRLVITVRSDLLPAALAPALQAAATRVDPEIPLFEVKPMRQRLDESLGGRRSPAVLAAVFAAAAVLLSGVGIYGVLAYTVTQRRREIGIRLALGALPAQVHGMFLKLGARLLIVGLLVAVPMVTWLATLLRAQLFGIEPTNPWILAGGAGFVALVAFGAALVPARRAARIPAMEAIRAE